MQWRIQVFLPKNCRVPHVCRVLQLWHTTNFEFCRVFLFLPCVHLAHARHTGMFAVCVSFAVCQEARHAANMGFAVCWVFCRVLPFRHTAKLPAHGNQRVSGSGCPTPSFHKVISPLQTPTGFLIPLQVTTIQSNCSEVQIVQLVVPFPCYLKIK